MQDPRPFGPQPGDTPWEDFSEESQKAIITVCNAARALFQNDERPELGSDQSGAYAGR